MKSKQRPGAIPRPPSHLISAPLQMVAAETASTILRETRGKERNRRPPFPLSNDPAAVLAVKGPLRRSAPLTAPGRPRKRQPDMRERGLRQTSLSESTGSPPVTGKTAVKAKSPCFQWLPYRSAKLPYSTRAGVTCHPLTRCVSIVFRYPPVTVIFTQKTAAKTICPCLYSRQPSRPRALIPSPRDPP